MATFISIIVMDYNITLKCYSVTRLMLQGNASLKRYFVTRSMLQGNFPMLICNNDVIISQSS